MKIKTTVPLIAGRYEKIAFAMHQSTQSMILFDFNLILNSMVDPKRIHIKSDTNLDIIQIILIYRKPCTISNIKDRSLIHAGGNKTDFVTQ